MVKMMKMKILAITLAMLTPAAAQVSFLLPPTFVMPRTIPWADGRGGDVLGTATTFDGKVYLRNTKGEHVATITSENGRAVYYDPSGNIIKRADIPGLPPDIVE
jgi:hypothetical protein